MHNGDWIAPPTSGLRAALHGMANMNDELNRPGGGDALGARLEMACAESQRLRVQHREAFDRLRGTIDSLNRFIFTRTEADCMVPAGQPGCSQPASPSA